MFYALCWRWGEKHAKLSAALGRLLDDYSLVKFFPLDITNEENVVDLLTVVSVNPYKCVWISCIGVYCSPLAQQTPRWTTQSSTGRMLMFERTTLSKTRMALTQTDCWERVAELMRGSFVTTVFFWNRSKCMKAIFLQSFKSLLAVWTGMPEAPPRVMERDKDKVAGF